MSFNRPFFDGNAAVKKISKLIANFGQGGSQKGKSLSKDSNDRKYPLGFTPPQDFYINKQPKNIEYVTSDDGAGSLNPNETGVFITRTKSIGKNGIDPDTGRHIEYGTAIVRVTNEGAPYILGAGNLNKTFGNGYPINHARNSDGEGSLAFTPESYYVNPDLLDERMTRLGVSGPGGYFDASVEYGYRIFNHPAFFYQSLTSDKLQNKYAIYNNLGELEKRKFLHILDYFQDDGKNVRALKREPQPSSFKYGILESVNRGEYTDVNGEPKKLYLGEGFFKQTSYDNEDPTYYGFDLEISSNSPLLNGDLEYFIDSFGQYDHEIAARKNVYNTFKFQLLKYIKSERFATNLNAQAPSDAPQPRSYQVKSIKGLDNIVENFGDGTDSKQFVDYKKDMIELEFQEDVSQNIGYLISLYKYLSYSRPRGKFVIPENLLRFDLKVTITDVRKFNRYVRDPQNPSKIWIFADEISRYEYTLYECQFKPNGMPHGDAVKNDEAPGTEPEPYVLKFDYKYSDLNFRKFSGRIEGEPDSEGWDASIYSYDVDNSLILGTFSNDQLNKLEDLTEWALSPYGTEEGRVNFVNELNRQRMTIMNRELSPSKGLKRKPTAFTQSTAPVYGDDVIDQDALVEAQKAERSKIRRMRKLKARLSGVTKAFDQLGKALANVAINQINKAILSKAAILNKTLESIRNGIPGLERMSRPRNVYKKSDPLEDELLNAFRAGGPLASALLTNGYLAGKERLKAALDKSSAFVPTPKSGLNGNTNVYGNSGLGP